jgi:hypothetical protein
MLISEMFEDADAARLQRARDQGFELPLFHGTKATFDAFSPNSHFGSEAQARMRRSTNVMPVLVRGKRFKRVKDTGRNMWDPKALARLERQGYDGVVYLNRYEGIPLDQFEALRERGIDDTKLSDAQFKKLVPAAEDSYIIFDPKNVRSADAEFHPDKAYKTGLYL